MHLAITNVSALPQPITAELTLQSYFLHVVPEHALNNKYSGAYKDVSSRIAWLKDNTRDYRLVAVTEDNPGVIDAAIDNSKSLDGALVEYTCFPRIIERIRQRSPSATISVRCHNIEPLQHLDNKGWFPSRGPIWLLYGMGRIAWQDWQSKRRSNHLLCINDWEAPVYWNLLPGKAAASWLPYKCPEYLIPSAPVAYAERRLIACMPTSQKNRKSVDLVSRFLKLAEEMKRAGSSMDFVITGALGHWGLEESSAVSYLGIVDDLGELLGRCAAVCVLSPLGHGFKTTIGDALAAGAHGLVHPKLFVRCPSAVRKYLLQVDTNDRRSIEALGGLLSMAPSAEDLTISIESTFRETMTRIFSKPSEHNVSS